VQAIFWDRGRPARNEREARKWISESALDKENVVEEQRACGAFAGGTPAVPENRLSALC
jgi:hypothetical protein